MIPKINPRGHSFKGVTAYLMHDKKAQTSERIAWSETGNLHTQDIEKAALVMAYIDRNADNLKRTFGGSAAGRKSEAGNVYHFSLSWAPGENPDQAHQRQQVLKTLDRLELSQHQYYMVAHEDTDHKHVHVVANLVNPITGKIHTPSFDKRELQSYALEYEREHIMHCQAREDNARKREQGQHQKHQEQKQDYSEKITRAYYAADNGKAFIHALKEEGLELAKARRGYHYVIVDDKGDIQKLSRQLHIEERGKLKSEAIQNKLNDIDREQVKDAHQLAKEIKQTLAEENKPYDRDAQEIAQQKALADAAEKAAEKTVQQEDKLRDQEQASDVLTTKLRQAAVKAKRYSYEKNTKAFNERERERKLQWQITQKTIESRQRWDIDELIAKRDQAKRDLQENSGFIARMTGKKRTAEDHLDAQEKTLANRLKSFEAEIIHYNKDRPQEIQISALKKQGFNTDKPTLKEQPQPETKIPTQQPSNDNMSKKITENDRPPDSWLNAKKKKLFDSRSEWEFVAFNKSVEEAKAKHYQAKAKPIAQDFNGIGELRSPEELQKTREKMQAHQEKVGGSFEDGLSQKHKEALQNYKVNHPQAADENKESQSQKQSQNQGHSIDHD